mmetsp:Transcript_6220/g.10696  ORF Transcript_6220/g.10696 Transcript_6220/m.10696 type:complete len:222 (-) Transcript_6220:74-739(-)
MFLVGKTRMISPRRRKCPHRNLHSCYGRRNSICPPHTPRTGAGLSWCCVARPGTEHMIVKWSWNIFQYRMRYTRANSDPILFRLDTPELGLGSGLKLVEALRAAALAPRLGRGLAQRLARARGVGLDVVSLGRGSALELARTWVPGLAQWLAPGTAQQKVRGSARPSGRRTCSPNTRSNACQWRCRMSRRRMWRSWRALARRRGSRRTPCWTSNRRRQLNR